MNKHILDKFFDENARMPNFKEFKAISGTNDNYIEKNFSEFIISNGYKPTPRNKKTYEVYDRVGNVVFVGIEDEIINGFYLKVSAQLSKFIKTKRKIQDKYFVRKKDINLDPKFYY